MLNYFRKIIYVSFIIMIIFTPVRFDFFYIQKYIIALDDDLYIDEDTVWNSDTDLTQYNAIYIEDNATLTIEPGTQLAVPNIYVYEGKIVAESTIDKKITLKSKDVNLEEIAQNLGIDNIAQYDEECFDGGSTITFDVDLSQYNQTSVFKYVQFENMGAYIDEAMNCPNYGVAKSNKLNLLNSVLASDKIQSPAVEIHSGKVKMKNVIFESNEYADVEDFKSKIL